MKSSQVTCPICGQKADFNAPPFGPFCSDRCKMIDLNKWFNGEYSISEPLRPDHLEEYEEFDGNLDEPEHQG
jgi:hypothetical protein